MSPEVIVHNSVTLDNAFTADAFAKKGIDIGLHYEVLLSFEPDALIIGSGSSVKGAEMCGDDFPREEESDFIKPQTDPSDKRPCGIFVDSRGLLLGKLHFYRRLSHIKNVVVLISETTPKNYVSYLEGRGYDYIVSGSDRISLYSALKEAERRYGFRRVVSDSGGTLNGVILNEGLADVLSLLVYPVVAGRGSRKLFENVNVPFSMELVRSGLKKDGIIHNIYRIE
ncbi:2,5-diamino-6-(ribosylamino)-4(3H)-pyrimidinone 5'-phosphate reductase [Methanomicrobium sp. W14]|uniref:dihydrofolate reductase family protein n=1 Tax=Methanomicrobium sp. W14 TaxID=2817839 RepID=UPI001AE9440E|nr:dihydrofolate reductase family protein [Methanomicrobium sp. W14]MBP2134168.1 2,5-diamino-6-(ribosylamino)-4(3H)-pyrimidinone 5'-phosphate reductase [Methanomicrobium sp. W14]